VEERAPALTNNVASRAPSLNVSRVHQAGSTQSCRVPWSTNHPGKTSKPRTLPAISSPQRHVTTTNSQLTDVGRERGYGTERGRGVTSAHAGAEHRAWYQTTQCNGA